MKNCNRGFTVISTLGGRVSRDRPQLSKKSLENFSYWIFGHDLFPLKSPPAVPITRLAFFKWSRELIFFLIIHALKSYILYNDELIEL